LELGDVTISDKVKNAVRTASTKAIVGDEKSGVIGIPGGDVVEVRDIQGIKSGQNYLVDIELAVPGSWSVDQTRQIEEAVRERAGSQVRGVRRVKVRFTSLEHGTGDFADEFIGADMSPRSSPEPEDEHDHRQHNHANGTKKSK